MDFQTHYSRTPALPEKNSGEKLVEVAGYITAQQRIESILNAGQRLVDFRKEQFDFPGNEFDQDFDDPTRNKNFDLADATIIEQNIALRKRIRSAGEEAREAEREAIEASLKASEEAGEASDKL